MSREMLPYTIVGLFLGMVITLSLNFTILNDSVKRLDSDLQYSIGRCLPENR